VNSGGVNRDEGRHGSGKRLWPTAYSGGSCPLHDIVITNIVWCMAYIREVGGRGDRILPNSRALVLHRGRQCR